MLRVNTRSRPAPTAPATAARPCRRRRRSRLGGADADLCGFPNGRRLADDVTDIEIRAVAQGYGSFLNGAFGLPNRTPNNHVGDGLDTNADMPFLWHVPVRRPAALGLRVGSAFAVVLDPRGLAAPARRSDERGPPRRARASVSRSRGSPWPD